VTDPRSTDADLTAKARIRNAALDLFAGQGEDRVSLRTVAAHAGVTVGLVQHHYRTKDALRSAVDQLVIDFYATAIRLVPNEGTPAEVAAARDEAVRTMLNEHPEVVDYVRRATLDPASDRRLLRGLTDLTRIEIAELRRSGLASTDRPDSSQIIDVMVRQLGRLFLQPMIDAMWEQLEGPDAPDDGKPVLIPTLTVIKNPARSA
jgi:TetR/AcrR family transcriptional regulator, regulator of cefoperazone and chloramphenicol sensitivity